MAIIGIERIQPVLRPTGILPASRLRLFLGISDVTVFVIIGIPVSGS